MNNIKNYFDIPFIEDNDMNSYYGKIAAIKNNANIDDKQLVFNPNCHFKNKSKNPPLHSSWIELGTGLKGGQCLKIEMDRKYKIWDILREISEMNKISPWKIRLKHIESGLYVHYLWQYNLYQIIQLIEYKDLNKDIINNKFVYYLNKECHLICYYCQYDDTYSYQTTYLPCHDNIDNIQNEIDKHEKYLSQSTGEEKEEKEEEEDIEIDDRYKHQFKSDRIWDKRELTVFYGDIKQKILLEDCSVGCKCWTDDCGGCRIAYLIQHLTNVPLDKQGWIVDNQIIDYFDENAAQLIFSAQSKIILFKLE